MTDEMLESLMARVKNLEDCMTTLCKTQSAINKLTLDQLTELTERIKG